MNGIFVWLPYNGNFLSAHGNTSTTDYYSMSFFAVFPDAVFKFIGNPALSSCNKSETPAQSPETLNGTLENLIKALGNGCHQKSCQIWKYLHFPSWKREQILDTIILAVEEPPVLG
jgi:hypothetical protein